MQKKLFFSNKKYFRVLMVSDLQEIVDCDPRSIRCYAELVDRTRPDLIVWGGDNIDGRKMKTAAELRAYLDIFTAPAERAGIPWMHIYGNHDYDMDITPAEQSAIYATYPHCISGISPEGVPGVSNYAVPVFDPETEKPAFVLYALDTGYKFVPVRAYVPFEEMQLENNEYPCKKWDFIRFEQLLWYWNTSKALEAEAGAPVPAMAVMHVPPYELARVEMNPEATGMRGSVEQKLQSSVLNSGVFSAMLERGDVRCIAAGHLHKDTVEGVYAGIRLCLDGCGGFLCGGNDSLRGGRVFDVSRDGSIVTEMIPYASFTDVSKA